MSECNVISVFFIQASIWRTYKYNRLAPQKIGAPYKQTFFRSELRKSIFLRGQVSNIICFPETIIDWKFIARKICTTLFSIRKFTDMIDCMVRFVVLLKRMNAVQSMHRLTSCVGRIHLFDDIIGIINANCLFKIHIFASFPSRMGTWSSINKSIYNSIVFQATWFSKNMSTRNRIPIQANWESER